MRYAGVDYSMSCPCMCIYDEVKTDKKLDIKNCQFHFIIGTKKYIGNLSSSPEIVGKEIPTFSNNTERFDLISKHFTDIIENNEIKSIGLEGYAYAGSGVVFDIAENTGLLKHKIWKQEKKLNIFSPAQVKKFATGSGRADKDAMYKAFLEETGLDLVKLLNYTKEKIESPIADIVDSYYICKINYFLENKLKP